MDLLSSSINDTLFLVIKIIIIIFVVFYFFLILLSYIQATDIRKQLRTETRDVLLIFNFINLLFSIVVVFATIVVLFV
jgi:hypothetical protein